MTTLFHEDEDERPDREVTLGIGSLLSIFFGVVLVCGIFFGFGYSMGRRNVQAGPVARTAKPSPTSPSVANDEAAANETATPDTAVKGEPHDSAIASKDGAPKESTPKESAPKESAPAVSESGKASTKEARKSAPASAESAGDDSAAAADKPARPAHPANAVPPATLAAVPVTHRPAPPGKPRAGIGASGPPPAAPVDEPPAPGRPMMVQIAAVSRQEDAEVLAGALRKRGFAPQVKSGSADKFFHVQVGPFSDKQQAESMKQHLLADGYNAILK